MSIPETVHNVTSLPQEETPVTKTSRIVGTLKSTFKRVVVPAAIGGGAYLLFKKLDDNVSDTEDTESTDE